MDSYQTDIDNRFKPILTDYLQVLFYISANFTDTDTYIHHTDTDTDYPDSYQTDTDTYIGLSNRYRYLLPI